MGPERSDRDIVDGWSRGISGTSVRADRIVHVEHVWNTAITINIAGASDRVSDAHLAIGDCAAFIADVDEAFSSYRPLSEVSLHRNGLDGPAAHSVDFDEVMAACRDLRAVTHGSFDPWAVAGGYDPSGYVKGWAAGRASARLVAAGFPDHLVNAGGDVCARGDETSGSGQGWPVGIVNPHRSAEVIEVVALRDLSMATSGRYERGDHVVVPATGLPAIVVDSATVIGPDPGVADALASAAMVDGTRSVEWLAGLGPQWSLYLVIGETARTFGQAFAT